MSFFDYINSTSKTAITSVCAAIFGNMTSFAYVSNVLVGSVNQNDIYIINTILQRGAWTIAMLAGIVSVVNAIDNFIIKHKNKKR